MKFKREQLIQMDLPYSAEYSWIVDHGRWRIEKAIIFKHDGKFYITNVSIPATECQEEDPWEYQQEIECEEVFFKEVTFKCWVDSSDQPVCKSGLSEE